MLMLTAAQHVYATAVSRPSPINQTEQIAAGISVVAFLEAEKARVDREAADAAARGETVKGHDAATLDRYIQLQRTKGSMYTVMKWLYNWTVGQLPAHCP